ncbi:MULTISPECIES: hypothetical protein [unclassified Nonomuraea]|uniref:hypothetical protein n=1 Tax=unclassified Nonomuraea TaxID=2593643 RepID=UPI00137908B7|nr:MULTISPECIES: hypothetical protein [unclassified Nonomuraea]NBE96974.1 hypothetical protein [Nonomuraea sp. K271]
MQGSREPDHQEILSGPGDTRSSSRNGPSGHKPSKNSKKIAIIAAAAALGFVAAAGGGYLLAGNPADPAQPGGAQPVPSQSAGGDQELQGDDDATMGDAKTDAPDDNLPTGDDDGSMGDVATDGDGGPGNEDTGTTGRNPSDGAKQTNSGKKPATTSPSKPPQDEGDTPADGPAGLVNGQCAKGGC